MTKPTIHSSEKIHFPTPEHIVLSNAISLYGFNGAKNDISRLDVLFNSGRWTEPAKLIAESTSKLFKSGTNNLSSFQLNEQIDGFGTTIKASSGYNTFTVSLYCLHRFLEPSLQLLRTCLTDIIFPENELEILQKNALSKLKTKYSACCYSKLSSIIGIFIVNVAGDDSVMKIVCDANVKSALSAVLNGADFTTKSTKLVAGFAIFNTNDNVP